MLRGSCVLKCQTVNQLKQQLLKQMQIFRPKAKGETNWIAHAGGAAAILKAMGPDAFQSEFEQSLLLAHHGSVVCSVASYSK